MKPLLIAALLCSPFARAAEIVEVTASGAQAENPATGAFDSDPGTRWAVEGSGQWIAAKFDEPVEIESVEVGFYHGERRYVFDLEVTNDGDSWENLGSFTSSGKGGDVEKVSFKKSPARALRLVSKGSNKNGWINLHTLRVPGVGVSKKLKRPAAAPKPPSPAGAGLVLSEVVPSGTVGSCVGISVANDGSIYLSETTRRNNGALDIRRNRGWLNDTLASSSVEDKRALIRGKKKDWEKLHQFTEKIVRLPAEEHTRREIFFEGLNSEVHGLAGGVLWHEGSAYVTCIPGLYKITDTTGDGVGDKVEELAHGFGIHIGYGGHDMHGPTVGPDGRIYWSIGDKGISVTRKEDGKRFHFPTHGGVMRVETDGTGFEVFAHGLRNPQELAFDEFGNLFTVDNDGDFGDKERFVFIVEGSDSGWRNVHQYRGKEHNQWLVDELWKPATDTQPAFLLPPISNYSAGPAGFVYNPGTALGERHHRHFFLAQSNKQITSFATEPDGASFKMVDEHKVVGGPFVIGLNFGPDGALYGADWGNNAWAPHMNGRVVKLDDPTTATSTARTGTAELLAMDFAKAAPRALANFIAHPDQRVRLKAQFELARRGERETLLRVARTGTTQLAKIHGLWGFGQLARKEPALATELAGFLADEDPEIRGQAAKVIGDSGNRSLGAEVAKLLADDSPRVRMFAGIALGKVGTPSEMEAVKTMIRQNEGADRVLRHAGVMALAGIYDAFAEEQKDVPRSAPQAILTELSADTSVELRRSAVAAMRSRSLSLVAYYLDDPDPRVAGEAARAIHDDLSIPASMPYLAKTLLRDRDADEAQARRAIYANLRVGDSESALRLAAYAADGSFPEKMRVEAINTLATWTAPAPLDRVQGWHRGLEPRDKAQAHAALDRHLGGLLSAESKSVQSATGNLIKRLDYGNATERVTKLALDPAADASVRAAALGAMSALKAPKLGEAVVAALKSDAPELRMAGRELLEDPKHLLPQIQYAVSDGTIAEKQHAIALAASLGGETLGKEIGRWLMSLESGKAPKEVALDIYLAAKAHPATSAKAEAYAKTLPAADGGALALALHGGNAERGAMTFQTSITGQCARCHRIGVSKASGVAAAEVGPELTKIGERRDREYLLRSMLNPAADIDPTQLPPGVPANVSVMPPMGALLKPGEIRDLVEYLTTLK